MLHSAATHGPLLSESVGLLSLPRCGKPLPQSLSCRLLDLYSCPHRQSTERPLFPKRACQSRVHTPRWLLSSPNLAGSSLCCWESPAKAIKALLLNNGAISPSCGGSPESQLCGLYHRKLPENNDLALLICIHTIKWKRAESNHPHLPS